MSAIPRSRLDKRPSVIQNLVRGGSTKGVVEMDGGVKSDEDNRSAAQDDHIAIQVGDLRIEHDVLADEALSTPIGGLAFDLEIESDAGAQSRAEAIVELIVKSDRVFLDGACWRCTERAPLVASDLGLCQICLADLKTVG